MYAKTFPTLLEPAERHAPGISVVLSKVDQTMTSVGPSSETSRNHWSKSDRGSRTFALFAKN